MWTSLAKDEASLGLLKWSDQHGTTSLQACGGPQAITLGDPSQPDLALHAVGNETLPVAGELFFRDTQAHLNFPQGPQNYSLRLVVDVVESTVDQLVLELCLSVQTNLLDSHPMIDLQVGCQNVDTFSPIDSSVDEGPHGSPPISIANRSSAPPISVLLGPLDYPFTANRSDENALSLRLFGDFLEKGVIRRARPWVVINRGEDSGVTAKSFQPLWDQLSSSPLPLS